MYTEHYSDEGGWNLGDPENFLLMKKVKIQVEYNEKCICSPFDLFRYISLVVYETGGG